MYQYYVSMRQIGATRSERNENPFKKHAVHRDLR